MFLLFFLFHFLSRLDPFRYLNDWRERDCLKETELRTLFGNIQQVYDFSKILLHELEVAGTDPARIAKCFIRLNDEFDAYTTYW